MLWTRPIACILLYIASGVLREKELCVGGGEGGRREREREWVREGGKEIEGWFVFHHFLTYDHHFPRRMLPLCSLVWSVLVKNVTVCFCRVVMWHSVGSAPLVLPFARFAREASKREQRYEVFTVSVVHCILQNQFYPHYPLVWMHNTNLKYFTLIVIVLSFKHDV